MSTQLPISAQLAKTKFDALKDIAILRHVSAAEFAAAQDIVKKYIQTHECILYGGIAIDFALRLKGDKIYEDDAVADYDFLSMDNIATARELIDIISTRIPNVNVYAIRGKFIRTYRISVGTNNWAADITYVPPALFACIPTLSYNGMKFVHPHMQFNDIHSSLSYPFDNPPLEVIFNRWKKDLARIDKLLKYYQPVPRDISIGAGILVRVPLDIITHSLIAGFAAFAIYTHIARQAGIAANVTERFPAIVPYCEDDQFIAEVPSGLVELFFHRNINKIAAKHFTKIKYYAPLLDFFESFAVAHLARRGVVMIYRTVARAVSYVSVEISGRKVRVCSIQALLKIFISHYIQAKYMPQTIRGPSIDADVYLNYYVACIQLVKESRGSSVQNKFDPTVETFGEISTPLYDMVAFHDYAKKAANITLQQAEDFILPPRRVKGSDVSMHATERASLEAPFSYSECPFMVLSCEELKEHSL